MVSHDQPAPIVLAVEPFGGSARNHNPNLPLVFWDDAAVTRGDGVFETLLVRDAVARNVRRHVARFRASAALLELPEPNETGWLKATEMATELWSERSAADAACVWTYTRGREATGIPSAWLTVKPIPDTTLRQRRQGVSVMTTPRGYRLETKLSDDGTTTVTAPWLVGAKTLSYAANMAALRWAHSQGRDDVIFVDGNRVLEGPTSTVVSIRGNKIRTPHSAGDILPGTTQAALFEYASALGWRCKEKDLTVDDLLRADSVWLVSSVRVGTRITRLDNTKLPAPDNEAEIQELLNAALTQADEA